MNYLISLFLISISISAFGSPHIVYRSAPVGIKYGVVGEGRNKPIALIFTTDIHDSLNDKFTNLSSQLLKNGFMVASMDIPCHGADVKPEEFAGLDCWSQRFKKGDQRLFDTFVTSVSNVVDDLVKRNSVTYPFVVAIGVSRGGFVALKVASKIRSVGYVVALSPVTNLQKLSEFSETKVDQRLSGFENDLSVLSTKHIFIQIGNDDSRVGTEEAFSLARGVVRSGRGRDVDLSIFIMPFGGHKLSADDLALRWIRSKENFLSTPSINAP